MKVKARIAIIILFVILSTSAFSYGLWPEVTGEAIYGDGADTLDVNQLFSITVWVEASDSATRVFWSTPFKFYGTGGVTTLSYQQYTVCSLFYFIDDFFGDVFLESWDGDLTDTDKFGYYSNPAPAGWDIWGWSWKTFIFDFIIEGDFQTEGAFCIDSGDFVFSELDWLFAPPWLPWTGESCWPVKSAPNEFTCGDATDDGLVNLLDITYIIMYLYAGGPEPYNVQVMDVNNSCNINILDITYIISYLYRGGDAPDCPSNWPCK